MFKHFHSYPHQCFKNKYFLTEYEISWRNNCYGGFILLHFKYVLPPRYSDPEIFLSFCLRNKCSIVHTTYLIYEMRVWTV